MAQRRLALLIFFHCLFGPQRKSEPHIDTMLPKVYRIANVGISPPAARAVGARQSEHTRQPPLDRTTTVDTSRSRAHAVARERQRRADGRRPPSHLGETGRAVGRVCVGAPRTPPRQEAQEADDHADDEAPHATIDALLHRQVRAQPAAHFLLAISCRHRRVVAGWLYRVVNANAHLLSPAWLLLWLAAERCREPFAR